MNKTINKALKLNRRYGIIDSASPNCVEDEYGYIFNCPICDVEHNNDMKPNYCFNCGQKLDWEITLNMNDFSKMIKGGNKYD